MSAHILTVAQQKGGAGKTTLVAQLAVALERQGRRVALIDIDPQASLAAWVARRRATRPDSRVHLAEVSGWRLGNELARIKPDFDLILIDSPPHAETDARAAIRAADLVLVPIQPSPMDLWATRPTLDLARGEARPVLVLLNRVPPRSKLTTQVRGMLADQGIAVAATQIGNRTAFAATLLDGLGVAETGGNRSAAAEIRALTNDIAKRLNIGAAAA